MVIYIIYQKFYADFETGEDEAVFIECGYKNRRKAIRKAKELVNKAKTNFYIDNSIKNKKNPFKTTNCVDLYKEKEEQENKVSSVVMEEIKLVA